MPNLTLDYSIELLEITDINDIKIEDLSSIRKRAFVRWHPDKVTHTKNEELIKEYQEKSQMIDQCVDLVKGFLNGTYHEGEKFTYQDSKQADPIEVLRKNADDLKAKIKEVWAEVKSKNYKMEIIEELIADGYKLSDLLRSDLKEDVQKLSIISLFDFGFISVIPMLLFTSFGLGSVYGIFWLLQVISCIIIFLPLSRFWLGKTSLFFSWFVNLGLKVGDYAIEFISHIPFVALVLWIPRILAKVVYFIMYPLYFLAIALVGERVVGQVKQKTKFYAGIAEWYVNELLNKNTSDYNEEELYHLAHLYNELLDVKKIENHD